MSEPKLNLREEPSAKKTRSPPKKPKVEQSVPKKKKLKTDAEKAAEKATKIATERVTRETNEKVINNMHKKGYTTAQIAEIVEVSEAEVEAVIKECKRV